MVYLALRIEKEVARSVAHLRLVMLVCCRFEAELAKCTAEVSYAVVE